MKPKDIKFNPLPLPAEGTSTRRSDYAKLTKLIQIIQNPGSVTDVPSTIFAIMKFGRKFDPNQDEDIYAFIERLHLMLYKNIVEDEGLDINPLIKLDDGYYSVGLTLVSSLEPSVSGL